MSFNFVTVLRSGGVFTPQWVDRLNRQAVQHLVPDNVVCLTDMSTEWPDISLPQPWPGWYAKMCLFAPGLFAHGERVFYVDLDSLILAPFDLSPVWARLEQGPEKLAMLDDFFQPKIPASGVMAWIAGPETERIYTQFAAKPELSSRWDRGDGYHIGRHPHVRLQGLLPGVFASYKAHKLTATSAGFPVVSMHGKPKFPDLPSSSWAMQAWIGPNNPVRHEGAQPRSCL